MEVASYDICQKAMEHCSLVEVLSRCTAFCYIEDGDRSLYEDKDIFLGKFDPEFGFIRCYVPTAVAKRTTPPFHELIPAPSIDEILEAFNSLASFGVKGELMMRLDTCAGKYMATFFRLRHSRDGQGSFHASVSRDAEDSPADMLLELLIDVAYKCLDPMTGEQK